jgi:multiple sugar transport system substrate-binding protein
MKPYSLILSIISLLLAGCSAFPLSEANSTPVVGPTPTATFLPTEETNQPAQGPTILTLWIPPDFDPASGTQAGELLQSRLDQYTAQRPDVRIETRIKASSGPGGLIDSLSTTSAAAQSALPDLILLPRSRLEIAALKGLLLPIDGLTDTLNDDDWFAYAQELARLQGSTFGLPFAGDALTLIYRPAEIENPPIDWPSTLEFIEPIAFPAADENSYFTLVQYLSTGAQSQDPEGRPFLDSTALTDVLSFYQNAQAVGAMPAWLTQFTTDEQTWDAFNENQANIVITWMNRYLHTLLGDTAAAPIISKNGTPLTLVDGFVWAISNPQTEQVALSVDLAEFLTQGDFLAEWTQAAGYLPPRASTLESWSNVALRRLVEQIVQSAQIIPPNDVMTVVGPALKQATVSVLNQQSNPVSAANEAVDSVENP